MIRSDNPTIREVEVTRCDDCPLLADGMIGCQHPSDGRQDDGEWWTADSEERPPSTCPLHTGALTIRLRRGEPR